MTDVERWRAVDDYICELFVGPDPALDGALEASEAAGLPAVHVTANQGKLLQLLARMIGARRILEVGTLGAYSTIWLARALPPGGVVVTMEINALHAQVARANLERAGVSDRVTLLEGAAADSLARLAAQDTEPFDVVFIDADKQNNAVYFGFALRLTRPGSVIVVDNVVRRGKVVDGASAEPDVVGTRQLNEVMAAERSVSVTEIQTVGAKGYDGFAVALVTGQ